MLIAAIVFLVVLACFLGSYWTLVLRPERHAEQAIRRRLRHGAAGTTRSAVDVLRRVAPVSTVPVLETALAKSRRVAGRARSLIERSGRRLTVGQLVLACLFTASLGFAGVLHFSGNVAVAVVAAFLLGCLPISLLRVAATRRLAAFEEQFPEAIDLIARALRAGHALTTGLGMVADEIPEPARTEFRLIHDKQNFGMRLEDAMREFADRIPLLDAKFFVTAVLTQREAGGNLSEVLDGLASLIRDRFRLKRHVRVMSAHGRITGAILACLPFAVGAILFLLAPQHMEKLFTDPLGVWMVSIAVVLQVGGFFWMRRIVNIEI